MKKAVQYLGYPLFVSWPLLVCYTALRVIQLPTDPMMRKFVEVPIFLTCAIPIIACLVYLEKKMPWWEDRVPSRQDFFNDMTHLAMCWFAISPIAQGLMRVLALSVIGTLNEMFGMQLWPSTWPLLAQVALAIVVGELGCYAFHRMGHETGLFWRLHATHHGTPQVYWLNSTRFHAFEVVIRTMFQTAPLIILGCNADTFLVYGAFASIHGWVQHSNVAYRTWFFNQMFATPANHRWHHSTDVKEANHNYGLIFLGWDRLFGTYYNPPDREFKGEVGIGDMPDFPKTYLGQFLTPFQWAELPRRTPRPQTQPAMSREAEEAA